MSCLAELSNEHLDISESLMLSASSNLFTLITLLFLFTRLKHKTKCLCENIFKNFHANSWQPLKKVAFSWHLNYKVWTKTQNVPVENSKNCTKKEKNTVSLFSMNFHTADTKALVFVMVLHMHTYGTISKVLLQPNVYGVYSIHAILVQ